jgi:YfiH family protein
MRQVHGSIVRTAVPGASPALECDGLATDRRGLGVAVQSADCVPLLLWASERNAVAAVHAGWRGSLARVAAKAIEHLRASYGARPDELHAAIGPSIRICCYEVGDEVIEAFSSSGRDHSRISKPGPRGRRHLDLVEDNRSQLLGAGVPERQIYDSARCTHCEPESFPSYRRDGPGAGRLLGWIGVR